MLNLGPQNQPKTIIIVHRNHKASLWHKPIKKSSVGQTKGHSWAEILVTQVLIVPDMDQAHVWKRRWAKEKIRRCGLKGKKIGENY